MLLGVFCLNRSVPSPDVCEHIAGSIVRASGLVPIITTTPMGYIFHLPEGGISAEEADGWQASAADGMSGIVVDGYLRASTHEKWSGLEDLSEVKGRLLRDAEFRDGTYNVLEWNAHMQAVRLVNDQFGFRCLYYWVSPQQTQLILGSTLALMRCALPACRPDWVGCVQQLLCSATHQGRSLLAGVRRLPPRSDLIISMEGVEGHQGRMQVIWGDALNDLDLSQAAERILQTGSQVIRTWIKTQPVTVSLSGGYDSRFLALLALPNAQAISAISLGDRDWIDADLAEQFCHNMGIAFERCEPPAAVTFPEYARVVRMVEHVSDYLSPSWLLRYAGRISELARPILSGFLGGPLTGSTVRWVEGVYDDWRATVMTWYASVNRCNVSARTLEQVGVVNVLQTEQELLDALISTPDPQARHPFQQLCSLELAVRQFGFVSLCTYNLFRQFSQVLVPFVDRRLVHVFCNLSPTALASQSAYKVALQRMDTSGIPYASSSSQLLRPISYARGPQDLISRNCRALSSTFADYVRSHRTTLQDYFDVPKLSQFIAGADGCPSSPDAVQERLILANAAILLCEYSSHR